MQVSEHVPGICTKKNRGEQSANKQQQMTVPDSTSWAVKSTHKANETIENPREENSSKPVKMNYTAMISTQDPNSKTIFKPFLAHNQTQIQ